jgi:hypothetical protein
MTTEHCRYYSPDELRELARRVGDLVERNRTIRLTAATGWIVQRALRSFAVRPNREQIMEIICGKGPCDQRSNCMRCMGKANAIIALYEARDSL